MPTLNFAITPAESKRQKKLKKPHPAIYRSGLAIEEARENRRMKRKNAIHEVAPCDSGKAA